jgi:hypothetical protein
VYGDVGTSVYAFRMRLA